MDIIEAIVLGLIQGLTEFLPISSTGHLYIGRHLFGLDDAGIFLDTMLHFGTLLAVVAVYWREITFMIKHPLSPLSRLVLVATIPTAIIGLLFKDYFEIIARTGETIGWEFLITGLILWMADRWKDNGFKKVHDISYTDALLIGTFQGAAIMPALSRSGLTIAAAIWRKIDKETAAYFSFLVSIPSITGAVILQSRQLFTTGSHALPLSSLLVGMVVSAVFGYIAVKWMIQTLKKGSLKGFALYVWGVGIVILVLQWVNFF
ncbi:undecaprenyl-diphosphate phosphatase [Hazenella sp. IB182357]|uniref:Undecaprenyl-diphosphatase n=1 Tax=Polycladospora coralii TaxID=2771432 RepID=A0A926NDH9_9BACL|nr:undecaprenyl-diphosphate phosphatase [Polycladospora coralii]MBD1373810.1 undecaprenyl-diphosphate phosphatase [Polycladospora coralii]MBS7531987.1 undecaprenyl-diphosphate phosphatase [Polycladospora coralii]